MRLILEQDMAKMSANTSTSRPLLILTRVSRNSSKEDSTRAGPLLFPFGASGRSPALPCQYLILSALLRITSKINIRVANVTPV